VYTFKVQARNAIGLGAMSSEVLIRASAIPAVPSAPTTTVVSNTDVTISWSAPDNAEGGTPVIDYRISWDAGVGTYVTLA
jgi:hypothetical protein